MEQYLIPKKLDFKTLRLCLDNFEPDWLYIRDCGGFRPDGSYRIQGMSKINGSLRGKTLDFKKNKNGLYFFIDGAEAFHFPLKKCYYKGFSLAYERIRPTEDGIGRMVMLSTGVDPDDPDLPEPKRSFLRNVLDDHLLEIFFPGKIPLKFHSWWKKEYGWKYWQVDTARIGKRRK